MTGAVKDLDLRRFVEGQTLAQNMTACKRLLGLFRRSTGFVFARREASTLSQSVVGLTTQYTGARTATPSLSIYMDITITIPDRAAGMRKSIPFRGSLVCQVIIDRNDAEELDVVQVDVVGSSAENGEAVVEGVAELLETNAVVIGGSTQTSEGHSAQLRVRARCGDLAWFSEPFSVCAHPCAIHNGPDFAPHTYRCDRTSADGKISREDVQVGLHVQLRVESDSGHTMDLDCVDDQEMVSEPRDHSPSMNGHPKSKPYQAAPEKASDATFDRHDFGFDRAVRFAQALNGQDGSWANDQVDIFRCKRCDPETWHDVPNSGYRITRRITRSPRGLARLVVEKEAKDCSIGDHASAAGPSPKISTFLDLEIEVRSADEEKADMIALALG